MLGRKEDAIREGKRSVELLPLGKDAYWGADRLLDLATVYVHVGEPDRSIELLERLLTIPSSISKLQLRMDPFWDPLRENPRFRHLVERG
jgi:serine/threonine-protein kinase